MCPATVAFTATRSSSSSGTPTYFGFVLTGSEKPLKRRNIKKKKKREEINGRKEELHRGMRNAGLCI